MSSVAPIVVGAHGVSAADVVAVARHRHPVRLGAGARLRVERSAEVVERLAALPEPVYGVSTGFGSLATTWIPPDRRAELQRSLIRSHAAGMGPLVEDEVVRALILLRARTLAMGYSGVRPVVVDTLLAMLDAGVLPPVHEHGSLGASGDLAPLAHVALALMGEGPAAAALAAAGIEPVVLRAKEGLALINGTDGMLGILVLALHDLERLSRTADVAAAMTVEAALGTDRAFAAHLMALRPHHGQTVSAENLRRLLAGSAIVASHRTGDPRVQDAYSLRCAPQVHGAARDTFAYAASVAEVELRSAIDNPSVVPGAGQPADWADVPLGDDAGEVASCGHFHGAPIGFVCDFAAVAVAELGAIAERRTDRLLDRARSHGLPPFLAADAGVNSGLMIAQYTQAAMVAENRRLAAPASVDSLPTSAMQEDHVSMGWGAARKLRRAVANLQRILAVEVVCAARALELRAPLRPAAATAAVVAALRDAGVGGAGPDRFLAPELAAAEQAVADGIVLAAAESAIGALR
jgi:histidine ammonia-lyase